MLRVATNPALTERERIPTRVFSEPQEMNRAVAAEIAALIRKNKPPASAACSASRPAPAPSASTTNWCGCTRTKACRFATSSRSTSTSTSRCSRWSCKATSLHARASVRPHRHPPRQHPHPRRHHSAEASRGVLPTLRSSDRATPAGSICSCSGIGRTGHIGFNEPGSGRDSRTRLITLDRVTRMRRGQRFLRRRARAAPRDHDGRRHDPRRPPSDPDGVRRSTRPPSSRKAVEGADHRRRRRQLPARAPQRPDHARRSRRRRAHATASPRGCSVPVEWTDATIRKAVIWLAQQARRSRSSSSPTRTTTKHGLQDLLAEHGPAYNINIDVFRKLQETITGWPGGKPDEQKRPGDIRRSTDDDLSQARADLLAAPGRRRDRMGGTLIRLVDQGHEVHVAYQTSGNIAVFDADAIRFVDFAPSSTGCSTSPRTRPSADRAAHRRVPAQQEAGPGRQPRSAADQGPDPPRRSARRRPRLRRAR